MIINSFLFKITCLTENGWQRIFKQIWTFYKPNKLTDCTEFLFHPQSLKEKKNSSNDSVILFFIYAILSGFCSAVQVTQCGVWQALHALPSTHFKPTSQALGNSTRNQRSARGFTMTCGRKVIQTAKSAGALRINHLLWSGRILVKGMQMFIKYFILT